MCLQRSWAVPVSRRAGAAGGEGVAWGDYIGSVVDGHDLLDLWTIQSVANEQGRRETVIVRVPFADASK
jgi:hypothetical protein